MIKRGFVLAPPDTLSDWISIADACRHLAEECGDEETELRDHYLEKADAAHELAVRVKVVPRETRHMWHYDGARLSEIGDDDPTRTEQYEDGNARIMRDGLGDIRGTVGMDDPKVGDEQLYKALELSWVCSVIAKLCVRYNHLDPDRRAGFFMRAQAAQS